MGGLFETLADSLKQDEIVHQEVIKGKLKNLSSPMLMNSGSELNNTRFETATMRLQILQVSQ